MSDVTISYKNTTIATMDASGTKTLETQGTYCEDDISVEYVKPQGAGGNVYQDQDGYVVLDDQPGTTINTLPLSVTQNGTYTASAGTAYTPVTVNVGGGGGVQILSGSLTPASNTSTVTISELAGKSPHILIFKPAGDLGVITGQGVRAFGECVIWYDEPSFVAISTNSSGSSIAGYDRGARVPTSSDVFYNDNGVITVKTGSGGGGWILGGVTYAWAAVV